MKDSKGSASGSAYKPNSNFNFPPQNSQRVSDRFFPNPYDHGMYPPPWLYHQYPYDRYGEMDDYIRRCTHYEILKDRLSRQKKKHHKIDSPMISKYNAVQQLLNTVDDIHENRARNFSPPRGSSTPGYNIPNHQVNKYGIEDFYKAPESKNDAIYKTMFSSYKPERSYKDKGSDKFGEFSIEDLIMSPRKNI